MTPAKPGIRRLMAVLSVLFVFAAAAALTFYFNPLWVNDQIVRLRLSRNGVRSSFVEVDGFRIHVLEAHPGHPGNGLRRPLVLIHGLGGHAEDWSAMMPALAAQGFDVYAPDLLGYGRSPRPDIAYTITDEEQMMVDFLHARQLTDVDLGGWSMGGWIAAKLTLDHPELVSRLALYDAAGSYFVPTYDASLFTPSDAAGLARLSALLTPHPRPLPGFIARAALRRLHENAWVIRRSLAAMTNGRELLDFRLHRITQPTLIVWGSDDRLIPPTSGERMHRAIGSSALLLITGCGHMAPAECSDPVTRATAAFFTSQPPLTSGESALEGHPQ